MGEQGKIQGVSRIIAGANITISPTPYGAGDVTITGAAGGGGGGASGGIFGEAALAATFTITAAAGVFQDTGLGVTLPVAGTYLIVGSIRVRNNPGTTGNFATLKLRNNTTATDIANSFRIALNQAGNNDIEVPINVVITTTAANQVINLWAARNAVVDTYTIFTDANGLTVLDFASAASNPAVLKTVGSVIVTNTVVETDWFNFSVPAGLMGVTGALWFRGHTQINQNAVAHTITVRFYFGGTLMLKTGALSLINEDLEFQMWVVNRNAQNNNSFSMLLLDLSTATATPPVTLVGATGTPATIGVGSVQDQAIDTSLAQIFRVSAQWSAAVVGDAATLLEGQLSVFKTV